MLMYNKNILLIVYLRSPKFPDKLGKHFYKLVLLKHKTLRGSLSHEIVMAIYERTKVLEQELIEKEKVIK